MTQETKVPKYEYLDSRWILSDAVAAVAYEVSDLQNRIAYHKHQVFELEAKLAAKKPLIERIRQHQEDANALIRKQYEDHKENDNE